MFRVIKIPTSFGYPVSAWMTGNPTAEKLAIVLPGFLDSKDYPHVKKLGEELANLEFLVICFDALGVWESKDAPIELYSMTNWLKEVNEVIDWGKKQYTTIKKVTLIGHSMGGMISLLTASQRKDLVAVCAIMSTSSFIRPQTYEERMIKWKAEKVKTSYRDNPDGTEEKIQISLDFSFVEDSLKHDILSVAESITCPVLLIAGSADVLISPDQVQELADKISQSEMKILDGVGHDYRKNPEFITKVNETIMSFLNEYDLIF